MTKQDCMHARLCKIFGNLLGIFFLKFIQTLNWNWERGETLLLDFFCFLAKPFAAQTCTVPLPRFSELHLWRDIVLRSRLNWYCPDLNFIADTPLWYSKNSDHILYSRCMLNEGPSQYLPFYMAVPGVKVLRLIRLLHTASNNDFTFEVHGFEITTKQIGPVLAMPQSICTKSLSAQESEYNGKIDNQSSGWDDVSQTAQEICFHVQAFIGDMWFVADVPLLGIVLTLCIVEWAVG